MIFEKNWYPHRSPAHFTEQRGAPTSDARQLNLPSGQFQFTTSDLNLPSALWSFNPLAGSSLLSGRYEVSIYYQMIPITVRTVSIYH